MDLLYPLLGHTIKYYIIFIRTRGAIVINHFKSIHGLILSFFSAILLFAAAPVTADTVDVSIPGFSFDPSVLTVNIGTTVRWTNNHTINHTATSDGSFWDSGTLIPGQSFLHTFDSAGNFPYSCTFHPSMTASVTVNPANPAPGLNIFGIIFLLLAMIVTSVWIIRRKAFSVS